MPVLRDCEVIVGQLSDGLGLLGKLTQPSHKARLGVVESCKTRHPVSTDAPPPRIMGGMHQHGYPLMDGRGPVSTGGSSPFLYKSGDDLGVNVLLLQHILVVKGERDVGLGDVAIDDDVYPLIT